MAIPCVHANKRGYPIEEGAHIAISEWSCVCVCVCVCVCACTRYVHMCVCAGTIRRFLEKFEDDIELVVFVVGAEYVSDPSSSWCHTAVM